MGSYERHLHKGFPMFFRVACLVALLAATTSPASFAADWPMYRADAARRAYVDDTLPEKLALHWAYHVAHPPQPAWPRSDRMPFDRAFHPVIADGFLWFASSADHKLYCVDSRTGTLQWTYFADAPLRFAPAVWRDRVFLAGDDGRLTVLDAEGGRELYRLRAGPDDRMLLGNGQMVSRWPARGGPAVLGDTVYFAAGIWPSDGIFLRAIDAPSGDVIWENNDSGSIYMAQPHGGANAKSGASAQGYVVVAGDQLYLPTGRAVPAAYSAEDGAFRYFHLQRYGHRGGAPTMAVGERFFNSGLAFDTATGADVAQVGGGALAAFPEGLIRAAGNEVGAYRWTTVEKKDRRGNPVQTLALETLWTTADVPASVATAVCANAVVTSAAVTSADNLQPTGAVARVDRETHESTWQTGSQRRAVWSGDCRWAALCQHRSRDGLLFRRGR